MACTYVCNWGYYCLAIGYTATVTMSNDGCVMPPPPGPCPPTDTIADESQQSLFPQWYLGPNEVDCTTHPEGWEPEPDPTQFDPIGGAYNSGQFEPDMQPIMDVTDNYRQICPSNFTFASVSTNDLWQEACITNTYCGLVYAAEVNISKTVRIPQLYFGVPWYSVEGSLIFTRTDAQRMAADALNWGEYRMRRRFKSNPNLTEAQLAEIWITEMNNEMTKISKPW